SSMASQKSSTYIQSRICLPPPYSGIAFPFIALMIVFGIKFSGCCIGPKLLVHRRTITGSLYVTFQACAIRSAAALVAEYGLDGLAGPLSSNDPESIAP